MNYRFVIANILLTFCLLSCVKQNKTSQTSSQSIHYTSGTIMNPATQNSSLQVGGTGWAYAGCTLNSNTLTAYSGNTAAQLVLGGGAPTTGNYSLIAGIPLSGQARLVISSAPNQPNGVAWYSQSGIVSVVTGTSGIVASFSNVPCAQTSFTFPIVTSSGSLTCL